jgi:hypothetical protein
VHELEISTINCLPVEYSDDDEDEEEYNDDEDEEEYNDDEDAEEHEDTVTRIRMNPTPLEVYDEQALGLDVLAQALGGLSNLTRVALVDPYNMGQGLQPWGLAMIQRGMEAPIKQYSGFEYVESAIRTLLKALIASRSKIRELGLLLGDISRGALHMSDELAAQISKSMKHLEHLHLSLNSMPNRHDEGSEEAEHQLWATTYPNFVGLFPQISRFTVDFDCEGEFCDKERFDWISETLRIPHLQIIEIRNTNCEIKSMLRLFQRHPTLKEIHIGPGFGAYVNYGPPEWHLLLRTAWSEMSLEKLVLKDIDIIGVRRGVDVIITDTLSLDKALEDITSGFGS